MCASCDIRTYQNSEWCLTDNIILQVMKSNGVKEIIVSECMKNMKEHKIGKHKHQN